MNCLSSVLRETMRWSASSLTERAAEILFWMYVMAFRTSASETANASVDLLLMTPLGEVYVVVNGTVSSFIIFWSMAAASNPICSTF